MATSCKQLGGDRVQVTSILSNPDQDPHLFEASPKTARALQNAALVVYNGADYDPWMDKLLAASKGDEAHDDRRGATRRQEVRRQSASLVRPGDHAGSRESGERLLSCRPIPAHKSDYDARLATVPRVAEADRQPRSPCCNGHYKGVPVTATEPVFGYMSDAIGLDDAQPALPAGRDERHGTERADIAAFESDLRERRVHVSDL